MKKLLTLGLLLLMTASAQPLSYYGVATFNLSSLDSSAVPFDSVVFVLLKQRADSTTTATGALDSATAYTSTASVQHKPRRVVWGHLGVDSLTYAMEFVDSMLVPGTVPVGIAVAFTDATPGPSLQVRAHIDFTRILDPGGTGLNLCSLFVVDSTNDVIVVGASLTMFTEDSSTQIGGSRPTGATGAAIFSLNNTTGSGYAVVLSASSFRTETAYQLFPVSGATVGSVYVYDFIPTVPTGDDSITLVFNVPNQDWRLKVIPLLQQEGHKDTAGVLIDDAPQYAQADGDGIIQWVVLRSTAADPPLPYQLVIYHKDDSRQLLDLRYITPDQSTVTVDW